jgi:hypothetical protein
MSVATDPTLTSILGNVNPIMPARPGASPVADPYQIASEDIGRQRALADTKLNPLLARQETMSRPQSDTNPEGVPQHWKPHYEHITGIGSFLRDAGKGILQALSFTGPGRAVEQAHYERKMEPYLTARGSVAKQIEDIQKQEELEERPIGPMGELAYHQMVIGTKEDQNRIRQQLADEKTKMDADKTDIERQKLELSRQKADQAVQKWRQQYSMELRTFQLRAKNLDRETARDQMDSMLRDQANRNYAARTAAGQSEKEASLATAADISQAKIDANNWLQRAFHVQPKIPPRPKSASAGGGGGNGVKVTDPRGVVHSFPDQNSANNFKKAAGIN